MNLCTKCQVHILEVEGVLPFLMPGMFTWALFLFSGIHCFQFLCDFDRSKKLPGLFLRSYDKVAENTYRVSTGKSQVWLFETITLDSLDLACAHRKLWRYLYASHVWYMSIYGLCPSANHRLADSGLSFIFLFFRGFYETVSLFHRCFRPFRTEDPLFWHPHFWPKSGEYDVTLTSLPADLSKPWKIPLVRVCKIDAGRGTHRGEG